MKPIWKLYDTTTSKYLTETCTSADSADEMCYMLNSSVANANVITVMDMIPDRRFSIYTQGRPLIGGPSERRFYIDTDTIYRIPSGESSEWRFYIDTDTIHDAIDRILLLMDTEDELLTYAYKIVYTVSPDHTVLEMQTGEHYPHEKEGEK